MIELEYASRALQNLNIEPTQHNINLLLKYYPAKNCEITPIWNNSGKEKKMEYNPLDDSDNEFQTKESKENHETIKTSNEIKLTDIIKNLGNENFLNKRTNLFQKEKIQKKQENLKETIVEDDNIKKKRFQLNFSLENIKKKYIFPFNQSLQKKINIQLRDDFYLSNFGIEKNEEIEESEIKAILNDQLFAFPFISVKVTPIILKELQNPINISQNEIIADLQFFSKEFPRKIFPYEPQDSSKSAESRKDSPEYKKVNFYLIKKNLGNDFKVIFLKEKDINYAFRLIESEEMGKFIGIFSHLIYWQIFGHVNPIQLDLLTKKQMLVTLFELFVLITSKMPSLRIKNYLVMPLVLLCLKMQIEQIFRNCYPMFFEEEKLNQIAIDKIFYLIDVLFDPANLNGRFIFLESDMNARSKKGVAGEKSYLGKRMYGLSPFINFVLPNPENRKTRAIFAKKIETDSFI